MREAGLHSELTHLGDASFPGGYQRVEVEGTGPARGYVRKNDQVTGCAVATTNLNPFLLEGGIVSLGVATSQE